MKSYNFILALSCLLSIAISTHAKPPTAPKGKKWEKIENLSDEFNTNQLDESKWAINGTPWRGRVPGLFVKDVVTLEDGKLKFTNYKLTEPKGKYTHACGLVASVHSTKYGYYETRMKASKTFMSSTFWLINNRKEGTGADVRTTELDITENVGINSGGQEWIEKMITHMNSNTHSRQVTSKNTPVGTQGGKAPLGGNCYDAYHTYAVWWKNKDELLFYLDDKFVYSITPPADFNLPMYLRMVTETYNWNPVPQDGGMTGTAEERSTYYDWTRSWKLVDAD